MYFLVENRAKIGQKIGAGRLKCHHNFLKFKTLSKRRRFGLVLIYPKRRRFCLDSSKQRRFDMY